MTDPRIECPTCGTSYKSSYVGLPPKEGVKGLIQCVCGTTLDVQFRSEWKVFGYALRKAARVTANSEF